MTSCVSDSGFPEDCSDPHKRSHSWCVCCHYGAVPNVMSLLVTSQEKKPVWQVLNSSNPTALSPNTDPLTVIDSVGFLGPRPSLRYTDTVTFHTLNKRAVFPHTCEQEIHLLYLLCTCWETVWLKPQQLEKTPCLLCLYALKKMSEWMLCSMYNLQKKKKQAASVLCCSMATGCHNTCYQCKCALSYFLMSMCAAVSRIARRCTCWERETIDRLPCRAAALVLTGVA